MTDFTRRVALAASLGAGFLFGTSARAAEGGKAHRVAFHVDHNDPAIMNLALNNVSNLMEYYHGKGEKAEIDVVAYGPGLNMLREDKSPVKDRLKQIKSGAFPSSVAYSACHNTMMGMEKREGHPIAIVPEATVVPAGIVRLTELQEQGWTYIKP
jgi:hypothetical protein